MPRPLLLIVDGEPLKSPGLISALEQDGWDIRWMTQSEARYSVGQGPVPDLLLLDPSRHGESSYDLAEAMRRIKPDLPLLVIQDIKDPEQPVPLPLQGVLGRQDPAQTWPPALRPFRPRLAKERLDTEDIFGDILADLDSDHSAPPPRRAPSAPIPTIPRVPTAPIPTAPRIPTAPIPVAPKVPTAPIPAALPAGREIPPARPAASPVPRIVIPPPARPPAIKPAPLPPLPQVPAPRPAPRPAPVPAVAGPAVPAQASSASKPLDAADIFGGVLEEIDSIGSGPAPKDGQEFTLSGIPGIADPFDGSSEAKAAPASAETPQEIPVGSSFPAASDTSGSGYEEFGNYYLLEKIAVGGMAELFKAKQRGVHNFQKIVAIKRILPHLSDNDEFVTMFIDEAKLAAQLTHPNIVQIFDLGKASGAYYIAMEYVDGRDLRSLLRRVREYQLPFPEQVAAYVAAKVAQALDYAHRKRGMNDKELKLVHRDISPQNILLSSEGAVKLVDFGIAKAATKSTQTMAGALKGKLLYMSPEQALGQPLDARSDIYSLGLVLFELLTGERCFQADSELGVLEKVRLGRVADVKAFNPLVSDELVTILNKALTKSVEQRYASARLMDRDLRELLARQGGEPTEHDVAEYVNALLRGTKEQVEQIMGLRFQCKGKLQPLPPPPQSSARVLDDLPTAADYRKTRSAAISQVSLPRLEIEKSSRPAWVIPVVGFLLLLIAGLVWFALSLH
jgi:serine/threonine protein kinase/CheY-like chemotaxis protein